MKITFDNNGTNQNVDKVMTTTYRDTRPQTTGQAGGYALDISGTVMDNKAYKGQGKTAEDVMQDAGQVDTAVWKDYMTVMSNSMSAEDYSRMMEEGCQPGDMDVEDVVTIIDKIKAELIKGGTQVEGYTDQIDAGTLAKITGSEAFARELCKQFEEHDIPVTEENVRQAKEAFEKAAELQELTEGAAKYMVENHREPTIDNLYRADYSSTADGDRQGRGYYAEGLVKDGFSGYYAKKAEEYNWEQLRPQMERVLEEAGLEVTEETLENARWLIEKGVPLTPESVSRLHELDTMTFPMEEKEILSAIAAAIADGKSAGEANLADGRSNLEKAAEYIERFDRISEQAVENAAADGKKLTLANLEAEQKLLEAAQDSMQKNQPDSTPDRGTGDTGEAYEEIYRETEAVTAKRQLEEIRLMMTIEANRKLLESGYAIDTAELEKLVEALKQIETQRQQSLFGGENIGEASEKAALYTQTRNKTAEIPWLPVDIAGRFRAADEDFTLNQVHIQGSALKNEYEEAREKYETLMTVPRADMGDSIRKAFRNVDDILQDMGLEATEENRRAVRILGYNRMELTQENIQAVKESDMELRRVIERMTPQAVLQTIRDGKNPLEMTIPELNDYLDTLQYTAEQEVEKYSRFLYKLDLNKGIDAKEREAYIGIYRLFRQIEKADDSAIGTILHNGAELSFKNLLSALRSSKKQGMDFVVDDFFGGIDAVAKNVSIAEQIGSGFDRYRKGLAGETADRMAKQEGSVKEGYQKEQIQEYRQLSEVEDSVIAELLHNRQPVTMNNLAAADMLMNRRGFLYKKLNELTKPADKDKVKNALSHLQNAMTDKDSVQEAYGEMQQVFEGILEEAQDDAGIGYIDLKAIRSCHKQLTLAGNLAQEEDYQIPVEINGEMTAIHLKVLHGGEEGGKVKAVLSTDSYGDVAAEFSIRNQKLSGYIACSTAEGTARLQDKEEKLRLEFQNQVEALAENQVEIGSIGIVHSGELDLNHFAAKEQPNDTSTQTADLYQIAKAFITAVTA